MNYIVVFTILSVFLTSHCARTSADDGGLSGATNGASEVCHLTTRCSNQLSKEWAKQAVDADLMQKALVEMQLPDDVNVRVAVVDSGFDLKSQDLFDALGDIHVEKGVVPKDVHPEKSYVKFKDTDVGDPSIDENGHGTMVASTIVGRDVGNAKSVRLAVYRITPAGKTGSTRTSVLQAAVFKACEQNQDPDGLTLINLSWGGRLDETQRATDEKEEAQILAKLQTRGCLVIKAAGNDNFRRDRTSDVDDAYLRVASIDASGELSRFSTVGEIRAPGSDIFVVSSKSKDTSTSQNIRSCNGQPGYQFVNGTSFAAPITVGIASQVVRVLKHFGGFHGLTESQRIQIVNRILIASQTSGSINGLRAVKIAQYWSALTLVARKESLAQNASVTLTKILDDATHESCTQSTKSCASVKKCAERIACLNDLRKNVALCASTPSESLAEGASVAFKMGEFELGHRLSQRSLPLVSDTDRRKKMLRESIDQYFSSLGFKFGLAYKPEDREEIQQRQRDAIRKMTPNFFRTVVAPYLHLQAAQGSLSSSSFLEFFMDGIMNSSSIQSTLALGVDAETGEDRGSGPLADSVNEAMNDLKILMNEFRFTRALEIMIKERSQDHFDAVARSPSTNNGNLSGLVRIINGLITKAKPASSYFEKLRKIESQLLQDIRSMNDVYANATEGLVFLEEVYPTRAVMDPLLARRSAEIIQIASAHEYSRLSPVEILYLQKNAATLLPDSKHKLALDLLNQIAQGRGWGVKNDHEIIENALFEISLAWKASDTAEQLAITGRFESIVEHAVDLAFLARIAGGYWKNRAFGLDLVDRLIDDELEPKARAEGRSYRTCPVFTPKALAWIAIKTTTWLRSIESAGDLAELSNSSEIHVGVGQAWRGLIYISEIDPQTAEIPRANAKMFSRLNPPTTHRVTVPVSAQELDVFMARLYRLAMSVTELDHTNIGAMASFDEIRAQMLRTRVAKRAAENIFAEIFSTYMPQDPHSFSNRDFMKLLPTTPDWQESVRQLANSRITFASSKSQEFLLHLQRSRLP